MFANVPNQKLLQSVRAKLSIAALSIVVLGGGALLQPRSPSPAALSAPQERSAPLLEAEWLRRAPFRAFTGLEDLGGRVAGYTVAIPGAEQPRLPLVLDFAAPSPAASTPAGFGVVVSPEGDVLTHAAALNGRSALQVQVAEGTFVDARLRAFEPFTGLALLRLSSPTTLAAGPVAAAAIRAGALAAAAARWNGANTVAAVFVTDVRDGGYYIAAGGALVGAGTPIFTLDGQVLAIASAAGGHALAYPVRDALSRLRASVSVGSGRPPSLGMAFQSITGPLARVFGDTGALVSDVVDGGPSAAAGIEPGDVVIAIGDTPIDSPDAVQRAIAPLVPASRAPVRVRRTAELRAFDVVVGSAFASAAVAPRREPAAEDVLEADSLVPVAALRAAGVPSGAQLLEVDGRPVSSRAEAVRELRRRVPVTVLYLQHQGRRFFAAVPGAT